MEDPASAEFEDMKRAIRKNTFGQPIDTICGRVKGKKVSGEDTGERPFLYLVKEDEAYVVDGNPNQWLRRRIAPSALASMRGVKNPANNIVTLVSEVSVPAALPLFATATQWTCDNADHQICLIWSRIKYAYTIAPQPWDCLGLRMMRDLSKILTRSERCGCRAAQASMDDIPRSSCCPGGQV